MATLPRQKKHLGQHFLISEEPIHRMLSTVPLTPETTVVEIGCGNGILTKALLSTRCKAVHVVEIDPEWARYIQETIHDPRLQVHVADAVTFDFASLREGGRRLVLLANLPYVITFPLMERLCGQSDLFDEAMVMIQEEAAERLTHTSGRRYGAVSVYLQHFFTFTSYDKVPPSFFSPPPKVMSRLVHFVPRADRPQYTDAAAFWLFVRACFKNPRQTLANNLKRTKYAWQQVSSETLKLRAQQLTEAELYALFSSCLKANQI